MRASPARHQLPAGLPRVLRRVTCWLEIGHCDCLPTREEGQDARLLGHQGQYRAEKADNRHACCCARPASGDAAGPEMNSRRRMLDPTALIDGSLSRAGAHEDRVTKAFGSYSGGAPCVLDPA